MTGGHCAEVRVLTRSQPRLRETTRGSVLTRVWLFSGWALLPEPLWLTGSRLVENRAPVKAPEVMVPPMVITPFLLVSRSVTAAFEGLKPEPAGQLTVTVPVSLTD